MVRNISLRMSYIIKNIVYSIRRIAYGFEIYESDIHRAGLRNTERAFETIKNSLYLRNTANTNMAAIKVNLTSASYPSTQKTRVYETDESMSS